MIMPNEKEVELKACMNCNRGYNEIQEYGVGPNLAWKWFVRCCLNCGWQPEAGTTEMRANNNWNHRPTPAQDKGLVMDKITPFMLHEIAKGDKEIYLKLMILHGHAVKTNKCKSCEGTGQIKHSNNPNLIGSVSCPFCGGTGDKDNKHLCAKFARPTVNVPTEEEIYKELEGVRPLDLRKILARNIFAKFRRFFNIVWPSRKDAIANGDGKGISDQWSIGFNDGIDACKLAYDQAIHALIAGEGKQDA